MDVPVMDKLEDVLSAVEYNGGGIKSVQRGVINDTVDSLNGKTITVNISSVNPDKAFAIITGSGKNDTSTIAQCYVSEITETSLKFFAKPYYVQYTDVKVSFGWQVIEFK